MKQAIKIEMELFQPLIIEDEYRQTLYTIFLEMIEDIKNSKITIKIDDREYKVKSRFQEKKEEKSFRYYETLSLKTEVEFDELLEGVEVYTGDGKEKLELSEEEKIEYLKSDIRTEIGKYIMDFIFATNLAYPGLFEVGSVEVFMDNKECEILKIDKPIFIEWEGTYINYLKEKWPVIHILKFEQVWNWLNTRTNFMMGISKTAIDRALNALTYTMGEPSYEQVFYILMGIEAIYNDNESNGIVEQIRAKTEALLKRPASYRKRISEFYENRSGFIHGKLNFPNKYCPYDAAEEFEEFYFKKYIKTVEDALTILIATIQEYIIQDASEMQTNIVVNLKK